MSLTVLLFVSLMGMTQVVNGQGFIQLLECTNYINDTNQCMTEYPVVSDVNPQQILTSISLDASIVCSNKPEYVSLITCIRNAITNCLSAEFNSIYPSAEAYVANYMYFCQNSENFHINCSIESSRELVGCLGENFNLTDLPTRDDGFYKWQDHICRSQNVSNDCLLQTKTSESCRSTFEMMKEMNRILVPPVCSKFTTDNASVSVKLNNDNVILFMVCLLIGVIRHGIYVPI